jgi:hypothetical protein
VRVRPWILRSFQITNSLSSSNLSSILSDCITSSKRSGKISRLLLWERGQKRLKGDSSVRKDFWILNYAGKAVGKNANTDTADRCEKCAP